MRYEQPNMEILELTAEDVVRTSDTPPSLAGNENGSGGTVGMPNGW